jgi:hypothetical protein
MSFDSLRSLRTIKGLDVLKYEHDKYNGKASFNVGFDYKFDKNYNEGDWKLINPMDRQIERRIF